MNVGPTKKKKPPRPPPPNLVRFKSKSTYNLTQEVPNLIDWSPPKTVSSQFGGSVSSSYSSSTSSLSSNKKGSDSDASLFNLNLPPSPTLKWANAGNAPRPRIIRPQAVKKSVSPPMPSIAPPSPPKGTCDVVTPYGIALFDFPASQMGDLPLQENDVVILIRRVNQEWLYGKVCDREGIFPQNFVQIEVPLPDEPRIVTALYDFKAQASEDLDLRTGQQIQVLHNVSDDWLFGECNGKSGQFPKNFVS